jgi:hypothetical protein
VKELASGALVAGRYRVEALLGRGGMGVVYRAVQLPMERPIALKLLRPELVDDPRARARFEREARVASALPHPSAVAIHDFGDHDGTAYLAMELVLGTGLRSIVEAGRVPTARAIELAHQLADVLASAHRIGLVHRDLKPENVVVEPDERVRVLDFGLAFFAARSGHAVGPAGRMTREGVVVGTPQYLSPEQARGEDVSAPTDVYALGCVLHELLSGAPPFSGSDMDVLTKQMFAPPPPLAGATDVPAALDELRHAMLEKSPSKRPSSDEVRDRLAALDPDPDRARARARQDGYLGPRATRMVDAPSARAPGDAAIELGVIGSVDASILVGLGANGIAAFTVTDAEPVAPETRVIYAPDASEEEIARAHAAWGLPVVTSIERDQTSRLRGLMRAGAADVAVRPVTAADLARRVRRLARDRARR